MTDTTENKITNDWVNYILAKYEAEIEDARRQHQEDIETEVPREDYIQQVAAALRDEALSVFKAALEKQEDSWGITDAVSECINAALEQFPEATNV